jgi:hypothetical protein
VDDHIAHHGAITSERVLDVLRRQARAIAPPTALDEATERGADAGRAAGSWVIDGNTSPETARNILRGIDDGDPMVMDMAPGPLSGEWAGESVTELLGDLITAHATGNLTHNVNGSNHCRACGCVVILFDDDDHGDCQESADEIADAYEAAYGDAYWHEVHRSARAVLDDGLDY